MIALWFWACGGAVDTPPPPAPRTAADCQRYAEPAVQAWCVTGLVSRGLAGPETCRPLGEHAESCQVAWVDQALGQGQGTRASLLRACEGAPDCALTVLDARPDPDITAQLAACRAHTGPYAQDCTLHALQRWAAAGPDAVSFARVAAEEHHLASVGALLGLVVACQGVGSCDQAKGAALEACTLAVEQDVPSRPEICSLGR